MRRAGTRISPTIAATAPATPPSLVPTKTARLTWLAPGSTRQMVSAVRNSASLIQPRSSTTTWRDQAPRPPPKLESAMRLKLSAMCRRGTRESVMHEVRIVREPLLDMRMGEHRIGRVVTMRLAPIALEHLAQPSQRRLVGHRGTQLATEIERAAIDIHRAEQRPLTVGDQQLGVRAQIALLVHLDAELPHHPQRGEGIDAIEPCETVAAAAEQAHMDAALMRLDDAVENRRVDEFRMLDIEAAMGAVDEGGHH